MTASSKLYNTFTHTQLKAEAFCAELLAANILFEDILFQNNGSFRKSYRNEIETVKFNTADEARPFKIEVALNRDGLYDRIPEGVFHQSMGNKRTEKVTDMLEEHKRYEEEEKWARRFFQPLEQEFLRYSTLVEVEEQSIALSMLSGTLNEELLNFWNIDKSLPAEPVKVLLRILPWAKYIKGDMLMTAKALELLLSRPVTAKEQTSHLHHYNAALHTNADDGMLLGINTVMGNTFEEPAITWKFTIGHVTNTEVWQFSSNHPYSRLLNQFVEIFVPLSLDIIFEYEVKEKAEEIEDEVLGYSMVI